jgi:hypothetical protein
MQRKPSEYETIQLAIHTCDRIIARYLDREKQSQAGKDIPLEVHRQLLMGKSAGLGKASALGLAEETAGGRP